MATLSINLDQLARIRRLAKVDTDRELAELIGLDKSQVSRVLTGQCAPGPKFIAGMCDAFGKEWFSELFDVVPDDGPERAA